MEWIPFEEFEEQIHKSTRKSVTRERIANNRVVVGQLQERYPSGKEWLSSPLEEKSIQFGDTSELGYILFWAWQKKIYLNLEYRHLLYNYLIQRYGVAGSANRIKKWVRESPLLTDNEWEVIKATSKTKRKVIKAVVFLILFSMKPFAELTDDDLDKTPLVYERLMSKKMVNDLRLKLGYTHKIVRKSRPSHWTTILFTHPSWGEMFREYHNYLVRANAKPIYIIRVGQCLKILMDYLELHSLKDCSQFTWEDFESLTNFLLSDNREVSSANVMIAKYKKFFLWGANENGSFPKKLEFPESFWKSLSKQAKERSRKGNGRAFTDENIADEIVKILTKYQPENELEQLCLFFWRIIVSCPARFSFVLNLQAEDALQRLPNEPNAYGIYSRNADKAGNKGGQFPFVDRLGIDAVSALQTRAKVANFPTLYNDETKDRYVHLFQLSESPWVLNRHIVWEFFNNKIKPKVSSILKLEESSLGGAHGFRHHILTEILKQTGSLEATQVAAGHSNSTMTKTYIKSAHAKKALLYRAIDKYEQGEITGKFYLRLIEALTTNEPTSELLYDLTKELTMEEFIKKHGRRTEMGFCFDEDGTCRHYLKCWSCPSFMMTREEIEGAVKLLKELTFQFIEFKDESVDFSYENTIAQNKLTAIGLIKERLMDLKISEEEITSMVFN
ncbi:hypothetical protein M3225_03695 [Priestia aryabhattai]|uniref:hypothetical protein n=1 Tax=Priestia aryabhattai TaxID=412384 RepID=UPI00204223BD|nr:hypothetical protein [Priestia aryabhattai]MCM3769590.1 hypothetical protein [Priestia aryabhattai]